MQGKFSTHYQRYLLPKVLSMSLDEMGKIDEYLLTVLYRQTIRTTYVYTF
jgi:hypothetical protein